MAELDAVKELRPTRGLMLRRDSARKTRTPSTRPRDVAGGNWFIGIAGGVIADFIYDAITGRDNGGFVGAVNRAMMSRLQTTTLPPSLSCSAGGSASRCFLALLCQQTADSAGSRRRIDPRFALAVGP